MQRYISEMYGAPGADDTPPRFVGGDEALYLDRNNRWTRCIVSAAELQDDGVTWVYYVQDGANIYYADEGEIESAGQ